MTSPFGDLARSFAVDHGLAASDSAVEVLTGGVSAEIVRVGDVVVKRARAELNVEGQWSAPVKRTIVEATAMSAVGAPIAPMVRAIDIDRNLIALDYVRGENWRERLFSGRVITADFEAAGRALGRIHTAVYHPPAMVGVKGYLEELRLIPYFAAAAGRNLRARSGMHAVVDRLRATDSTVLVHGDYSPKNLLCLNGEVVVLDWEVAHRGAPEFDLAFVLAHLIAKQIHLPHLADQLQHGRQRLLATYQQPIDQPWLDQLVGALLVARVDGQSPLTYLTNSQQDVVRQQGLSLLYGHTHSRTAEPNPGTQDHEEPTDA